MTNTTGRRLIASGAFALVAFLAACDVERKPASVDYETTTTESTTSTTERTGWEALEPAAAAAEQEKQPYGDPAVVGAEGKASPKPIEQMTPTERERFLSWDGTGEAAYNTDGIHDGRFSDITCETWLGPQGEGFYRTIGGLACTYDQTGLVAVQGIAYHDGAWHIGDRPFSLPGECPDESDCVIVWDHATTSPKAVRS